MIDYQHEINRMNEFISFQHSLKNQNDGVQNKMEEPTKKTDRTYLSKFKTVIQYR
jgi:hypothetical protein